MTTERGVRAGETIRLRARFRDDLGAPAQAGDVYVNIYEPDTVDFDPINAQVVSGVPTYLGEGIFEYAYTTPLAGPDGIWYDQWLGDLTVQTVSGLFDFEVTASGIVTKLPSQLNQNNVVEVMLTSGIQGLDGSSLEEQYEFSFMTSINPNYTSVRKIRLKVGAYVRNLYDDALQTAILEGSIEADLLTWNEDTSNTPLFQHARREFVTCVAAHMLLNNIASNMIRSKSLNDLRVEYDPKGLERTLSDLMDCINKWEPQLLARGLARAGQQPQRVIKGEYDPDRISPARMWESTDSYGVNRRIPAANTRLRPIGNRRWLRTHRNRNW
jgi:hypothetical protein